MSELRALPHRPDAENALLGGILVAGREALEEALAVIQDEDDLYRPQCKAVFRAMRILAERGQPLDVITLSDQLRRTGEIDLVGGIEGLARLDRYATPHNITTHAELIREAAKWRRLALLGRKMHEDMMAVDGGAIDDIDAYLSRRQAELANLAESGKLGCEPWSSKRVLDDVFTEMVAEAKGDTRGVSTGLPELDKCIGRRGPKPGWLIVLGGRPKMGKTSVALSMTRAAGFTRLEGSPPTWRPRKQPVPVLWACDEMRAVELMQRQIADLVSLEGRAVCSPTMAWMEKNMNTLGHARRLLESVPLHFVPDADSGHLDRIFRYARHWRASHRIIGRDDEGRPKREPAIVVVDYLQRMADLPWCRKDMSTADRIGEKAKYCKTNARSLDVVVLLLSQLNRDLEKRPDKRPIPADFRGSGEIEQEADAIIGAYRDIVYDENADEVRAQVAELTNRSGLTGHDIDALIGDQDHPSLSVRCKLRPSELDALVKARQRLTGAELIVLANRHGPTGTVHVDFFGEHFRFLPKPAALHDQGNRAIRNAS